MVCIRNVCGTDELAIENTSIQTLLGFLESLLHRSTADNKIHAAQIVVSDRDRLLALLYISMYGDKIESTLHCRNCGQKFDLDFSLRELLTHYYTVPASISDNGRFEVEPGISFRLPTGEDEILATGSSIKQAEQLLLERCLLDGNIAADSEKVQSKMAALAPVLNLKMEAHCPECEHSQEVQFDMQSFFLAKIKQERPLLIREIHSIASQYHWSQQEILELPRKIRKQYAALIESDN